MLKMNSIQSSDSLIHCIDNQLYSVSKKTLKKQKIRTFSRREVRKQGWQKFQVSCPSLLEERTICDGRQASDSFETIKRRRKSIPKNEKRKRSMVIVVVVVVITDSQGLNIGSKTGESDV